MQPKPGDPREQMHQAAIRSLKLVEDKLRKNFLEKKATHHKESRKEEFKRQSSRNEASESSIDKNHQKRKEDARNIIAQARVNNACYAWKEENYKDDKKRWAHYALPAGFAECRYPKDSSCHTISKNMMGHMNPCYGFQTTCKQYKYSEEQEQQPCKVCSYTSPAQHGPG
jgi:hypothetical protein